MRRALLAALLVIPGIGLAAPVITVTPASIIQGEPAMVTIDGATTAEIKKITFGGARIPVFSYQKKPTALIGIDLNKKAGTYPIVVTLTDGAVLTRDFVVGVRERIEAPLSIPAKLGGNTSASQTKLVSTLAAENASLANLRTGAKAFWTKPFIWPLASVTITDSYGYSRLTGAYTITHKGTDLRAKEGTSVMVINRGVVRVAKTYRNYGKTIVVDHGLGVMSFYMHLSKIYVTPGELVVRGQIIGKSGKTGYAEQPHLHLTIRINGVSIDPAAFLALFK